WGLGEKLAVGRVVVVPFSPTPQNPGRGREQGGSPGRKAPSPGRSSAAPVPAKREAPVNTAMAEALRKAGLGK
ncbi:MAG: hypothetical protein ACK4K6_07345, partial [Pseudarthrobacter sp.]